MRNLALLVGFVVSVLFSSVAFGVPEDAPVVRCDLEEGTFALKIYEDPVLVEIIDVPNEEVSFTLNGLELEKTGSIYRLFNRNGAEEDLPEGLIFETDLSYEDRNGFTIDDHSGSKTYWLCY